MCAECRFWFGSTERIGECRRRAPRMTHVGQDGRGNAKNPCWPDTLNTHWCGESEVEEKVRR